MSLNEAIYGKIFLYVIVPLEVNRVHFAQRKVCLIVVLAAYI